MPESTDILLDALCRAAFQPQMHFNPDGSSFSSPSPLLQTLATLLQKAYSEDEAIRALILAELTKPETIQSLAGEIAKGVGRMRVSAGYSSWDPAAVVPEWIQEALTASLVEWLGTEEAAGLVPQMLERGTIKITVERADANDRPRG